MHEPPLAFVSHRTSGRIRLKVPSKRGDSAFFASIVEKISSFEGVRVVETNHLTAGILVLHSAAFDKIIGGAAAGGLFRLGDVAQARTNLHRRISGAFETMDVTLRDVTGNELDAGGAAFLTLVGLGIYQIWRGNIAAVPWYAAAWYAFNIFLKSNAEKQPA